MSGTNNPYDPTEIYKRWAQQNEQFQSEFQKGFERMRRQIDEISRLPESWRKISEQMEAVSKQGGFGQMAEGAQQFTDMMKAAMSPWQQSTGQPAVGHSRTQYAAGMGRIQDQHRQQRQDIHTWEAERNALPEAERNALGLEEGDLVQVVVLPVVKKEVNK